MTRRDVAKKLDVLREKARDLMNEYSEVVSELRDTFDERSEAWQMGEKGEAWQEMIDGVTEQMDKLDEVAEYQVDD